MATLLSPVTVGAMQLQHRVVLAPMTRYRADADSVPLPFVKEYYAQRAAIPGTLLITEGTFVSARAGGFEHVPGLFTAAQVEAWREITDAVHAAGSFVFCQLWALGRAAKPEVLQDSGNRLLSASAIPMSDESPEPEAMSEVDIHAFIQDYVTAARNAVDAGFDGVEIHGANGYLPDQFTQPNSNKRTDAWGGDVERRAKFGIEVARAVTQAIGADRVGYRISPWSPFQGMGMADPKPQFSYLASRLCELDLAYLHVVEPRISGANTIEAADEEVDFLVDLWAGKGAVILAGGFTSDAAEQSLLKHKNCSVLIAFGRVFLANPDLPYRIANKLELNSYDRSTFYVPEQQGGYIDYPFSKEYIAVTSGATAA